MEGQKNNYMKWNSNRGLGIKKVTEIWRVQLCHFPHHGRTWRKSPKGIEDCHHFLDFSHDQKSRPISPARNMHGDQMLSYQQDWQIISNFFQIVNYNVLSNWQPPLPPRKRKKKERERRMDNFGGSENRRILVSLENFISFETKKIHFGSSK